MGFAVCNDAAYFRAAVVRLCAEAKGRAGAITGRERMIRRRRAGKAAATAR